MIHTDLTNQLQLLLKTSAPPLLEVSQQQLQLPQLVPGQKVPAHVLSNLPNGRFEVLIADKTLDMNLPRNTQPGDSLELVFVTAKPRLTFILANDLANLAGAGPASAKPQVTLSETARFLGGLLEKVLQPETAQARAASVAQTAPLLSGAPGKTLDVAQILRGALTHSGLFYESHQAQWVTGQRPLTDLLREPQGRLSPAANSLPQGAEPARANVGAANPGSVAAPLIKNESLPQGAEPARGNVGVTNPGSVAAPLIRTADPQAAPSLSSTPGMTASPGETLTKASALNQPAHPETVPLVRQQLEALDTRQVAWQGQIWPGQTMEWRVEERAAREQDSEMIIPEWHTSLHLILPQLGEISARLSLQPQGIRLQIAAADPASARLLAEQRAILQQGMENSGLQLVEMKVSHETAG